MDDGQDIETGLILLSARGKRLVILRTDTVFTAVVLDQRDCDALLGGRPRITAPHIAELIRLVRIAVESGQA